MVEKDLEMAVLDFESVMVPPSMEVGMFNTLQESHRATETMPRLTKGSIIFPWIRRKIKAKYKQWKVCKKYRPSKQKKIQEMVTDGLCHGAPMECLLCDHFDFAGWPFSVTVYRVPGKFFAPETLQRPEKVRKFDM